MDRKSPSRMSIERRTLIAGAGAGLLGATLPGNVLANAPLLKTIPATGEQVPAIGMGSWLTFDVGSDTVARAQRTEVLRAFFKNGGAVVDSSPMYGSSQSVIGAALNQLGRPGSLFAVDKVWTPGGEYGPAQINRSRTRWGVERFDLLQVHNLVDWRRHLETLFEMKAEGRLRYVGVTSYAGLRYGEIASIMETQPLDFIQVTYNVLDREAEQRLLPLAAEKGIAVIANRPFREGQLFRIFESKRLPAVAAELGATTWAQFMLKFVISHPALTVAIPATRRVDHMRENMGVLRGPLPDAETRAAMLRAISEI